MHIRFYLPAMRRDIVRTQTKSPEDRECRTIRLSVQQQISSISNYLVSNLPAELAATRYELDVLFCIQKAPPPQQKQPRTRLGGAGQVRSSRVPPRRGAAHYMNSTPAALRLPRARCAFRAVVVNLGGGNPKAFFFLGELRTKVVRRPILH